jgi:hypothetical protein
MRDAISWLHASSSKNLPTNRVLKEENNAIKRVRMKEEKRAWERREKMGA